MLSKYDIATLLAYAEPGILADARKAPSSYASGHMFGVVFRARESIYGSYCQMPSKMHPHTKRMLFLKYPKEIVSCSHEGEKGISCLKCGEDLAI